MAGDSGGFWSSIPGVLTGIAGVIAAMTGLYVAFKPAPASYVPPISPLSNSTTTVTSVPPKPSPPPKPHMGPLQHGWNYDHNDLNADGWLSIGSAEACSDLCYARTDCKAMTYVTSNRSCWLKYAVPDRTPNRDMTSAVKQ